MYEIDGKKTPKFSQFFKEADHGQCYMFPKDPEAQTSRKAMINRTSSPFSVTGSIQNAKRHRHLCRESCMSTSAHDELEEEWGDLWQGRRCLTQKYGEGECPSECCEYMFTLLVDE